jgi:hypothetical protein
MMLLVAGKYLVLLLGMGLLARVVTEGRAPAAGRGGPS